jgi:hypothetical protein
LFDVIKEDKLVSYDDIPGQYNVNTDYDLMISSTGTGKEVTAHEDWNYIWKIHAPPSAKHLLWRICKGSLPIRIRLKERCVPCHWLVHFVIIIMKMIGTFFSTVMTVFKQDKVLVLSILFHHGSNFVMQQRN